MMLSVTLFAYQDDEIKIDIEARFEGDSLIIDGYDIGKKVKEYWGDSDYEYSLTLPPSSVDQLCTLLKVSREEKHHLLRELAMRFNSNTCFSDIRKLLDDHDIPCEGFSWI